MAKEVIRVTIRKDGTMNVETQGVAGKSCMEVSKDLELYLGQKKGNAEITADYYKPEPKGPDNWISRK